jgi:iron-sulfur cluster assembly protein
MPELADNVVILMSATATLPSLQSSVSSSVQPFGVPEGVREGNENLVKLTDAAGAKVGALIARDAAGKYLRVAISGGGCNGLSYRMKFVSEAKRGDILVRTAGVPVVVDSKSALYLKGTHLDYSSAMIGGGFKFSNPNAKASCSCGESFSV